MPVYETKTGSGEVTAVVLRNGVNIDDPATVVLGFIEAWRIDESAYRRGHELTEMRILDLLIWSVEA